MPISTPVQIFPNDIRPNVGIGVNIPFDKPEVFSPNYQTKEAIKNNIINFFLTNPGERLMNPSFGGGLRNFIFEQLAEENISIVKSNVQEKLNIFFPNVNIIEFDMNSNPDKYSLTIFIKYSIKNTQMVDSISIDFNQ
jgi:phage baseplate assembly protein W